MKLIIDIPEEDYDYLYVRKEVEGQDLTYYHQLILNGTPLDDVKNKILGYNVRQHVFGSESFLKGIALGMDKSVEILDNIEKEIAE